VREGAYLCGDWLQDEAELGSQLAALVGRALPLAAAVNAAPRSPRAPDEGANPDDATSMSWGSQAFTGPGELFDAEGRSWLQTVVVAAHAGGFVVHGAAVLERDEARTAGVLVGFGSTSVQAAEGLPAELGLTLAVQVERREDGRRRVKVHSQAPERGFDFNGSGTM
jgi:hypothetical protein